MAKRQRGQRNNLSKEVMDIEIGDTITFSVLIRYRKYRATRKVNGFTITARWPTVIFNGYRNFVVAPIEVSKVIKK